MADFERRREEFGERMRHLRELAGLSGKDLAESIGWARPKVSKLETGKQTASRAELEVWLAALLVPEPQAEELRELLTAVHEDHVSWRQEVRAGLRAMQEDMQEILDKATSIRIVDIGVVPGLLQTADYARAILEAVARVHGGGDDVTEAVRTRMQNQQVLFSPGKTIDILMTESAITQPVASPGVMAGQIHRLIAAIGVPGVRFGILPTNRRLPYMLGNGWWLIDQMVMVETVTRELRITDPDEVEAYSALTDQLWSVAVEGDDARALLARVATELG